MELGCLSNDPTMWTQKELGAFSVGPLFGSLKDDYV